jgi:hypothetical protein
MPYIGFDDNFDETPFSDSSSYWYWEGPSYPGFNAMFYGNLMMRIVYDTLSTDISENKSYKNYIKLNAKYIEISSNNKTNVKIKAYSIDGRKVLEINDVLERGIKRIPLKFKSKGIYLLDVETNFKKEKFKFLYISE